MDAVNLGRKTDAKKTSFPTKKKKSSPTSEEEEGEKQVRRKGA